MDRTQRGLTAPSMSQLHAIAYVSSATPILADPVQLDALLVDAREFNASRGVSGVLLHQGGNFLQYIEGPRPGVTAVYNRIQQSSRHFGMIELLNQTVTSKHFQEWHMGFVEPTQSDLQAISQACWLSRMVQLDPHSQKSAGLDLLLGFWARAKNRR